MRVALLSYNARVGDAIGNQVAEKFSFFQERGADVRVFVENDQALHPTLRGHEHLWPAPSPVGPNWDFLTDADLICVEYGQHYALLMLLPLLQAPEGLRLEQRPPFVRLEPRSYAAWRVRDRLAGVP